MFSLYDILVITALSISLVILVNHFKSKSKPPSLSPLDPDKDFERIKAVCKNIIPISLFNIDLDRRYKDNNTEYNILLNKLNGIGCNFILIGSDIRKIMYYGKCSSTKDIINILVFLSRYFYNSEVIACISTIENIDYEELKLELLEENVLISSIEIGSKCTKYGIKRI